MADNCTHTALAAEAVAVLLAASHTGTLAAETRTAAAADNPVEQDTRNYLREHREDSPDSAVAAVEPPCNSH